MREMVEMAYRFLKYQRLMEVPLDILPVAVEAE
jgi:hypothetical protein